MQITIETTLLADADLALGYAGPLALILNGTQLYDEADFFRAAAPTFFPRGNIQTRLQFQVTRIFATLRQAQAFALQHWGSIPRSGLVTVTAGDGSSSQTLYLRNAIVDSAQVLSVRGVAVAVQYIIRGGLWESDIPVDEIPGPPDPGESFAVIRRAEVAITAGATSVAVVFSSPLAATPIVVATVSRPAGGDAIWPIIDQDTVTVDGFTADLSGTPSDGTYKLNYIAVE